MIKYPLKGSEEIFVELGTASWSWYATVWRDMGNFSERNPSWVHKRHKLTNLKLRAERPVRIS